MASDDQVIVTAAGNVAPIVQRGSRRLAAGGPHRTQSLRRVASEADLSEAGVPSEDNRLSEPDHETGPLTVNAARSQETSRDFTFARGISPPQIASPPPGYLSPSTERSAFATAMSNMGSEYRTPQTVSIPLGTPASTARPFSTPQTLHTAPPSTIAGTAQPFSSAQSMHTAPVGTPTTTAQDFASSMSMHTAQPFTPMSTARAFSPSGSMHTAPQSTAAKSARGWTSPTTYEMAESHTPSERTAMPTFAVSGRSPSSSAATAIPGSSTAAVGTARTGTQYSTARDSAYSTASGGLMSPFDTADDRASRVSTHSSGSLSTYDTAPPPVPSRDSRYDTASLAPSSPRSSTSHGSTPTASSPRKWQLQDAPVPSMPSAYESAPPPTEYDTAPYPSEKSRYSTAPTVAGSYLTARPATTPQQSEQTLSAFKTASAKSPSEYSTAPPPPVSKSASIAPSEGLSWRSDVQEAAETATRVSDTTDLGLIADLERNSSSGSSHSLPRGRTQYETAQAWSTLYGTAPEGTTYGTARETVYQTANGSLPSWYTQSTYMTTAQGTQE